MTKDEALKLALEALETSMYPQQKQLQAITAIKEALAQPEQEPKCGAIIEVFGKDWRLEYLSLPVGKHKLYTQQYTYTTPPQRTWVGLTDVERRQAVNAVTYSQLAMTYAEWVHEVQKETEQRLKEKNT